MTLPLPGVDTLPPESMRQRALSQWDTPPWAADALASFAAIKADDVVLEPSAGLGRLIDALPSAQRVIACELDPRRVKALEEKSRQRSRAFRVCQADFRATVGLAANVTLQNPPYEDGLDVEFIEHALTMSPRTVGLFRLAIVCGQERAERLWRWHDALRIRYFAERPDFGGEHGAKTDFLMAEIVRRSSARRAQESTRCEVSWFARRQA